MSENLVTTMIIDRIDKLDEKMDENTTDLRKDVTDCTLEIQGVKKDLKNHLDNKKAEDESSKRKVYFATAFLGVAFTAYAAVKELF